jgi:hypothetical protein
MLPWRHYLYIPALLLDTIESRMLEVESGTFSRFAVELVCYDLRTRRDHSLTGPLSRESATTQDAVDRAIVAHFRPGSRSAGDTIRALLRDALTPVPASSQPSLVKVRRWVFFPALLSEIIEVRRKELGFRSISDYVTSLIRYDLLLGGPHKFFRGDDCTLEMLEALDRETLAAFHANVRPRTLADHLAEEVAGEKLSRAEREAALGKAGQRLVRTATRR